MKIETTIGKMNPGESGVICGFDSAHSRYRDRLLVMGLTKGTRITVLKRAPLGDPVEIELRNYKLSLRKEEAAIVKIEAEGEDK